MELKFIPMLIVLLMGVDAGQVSHIVTDCNPICKTCYAGLKYHCLSCFDGAIWYKINRYYTCKICPAGCVSCSQNSWCKTCKKGRYGINCDKYCSIGCQDGKCDRYSGHCRCRPNFDGHKCERRFRSAIVSGGHNREGRPEIAAAV